MGLKNRLLYLAGHGHLAHALHTKVVPTEWREFRIKTRAGHDLYCHLHRPRGTGQYPGVVIVPGANSTGTAYDRVGVATADEIACLGFSVVHYDPSGRGKSGGTEDFWGTVHQEELVDVLWHTSGMEDVDKTFGLSIFSFSIGIIIACGALIRENIPPVRLLYDWEGPSNRFVITRNDQHKPLKEFPTHRDDFWCLREPVTMIGRIRCGYFRYQAEKDHVQGHFKEHAIELLNTATAGQALWTRLNENPPNKLFDNHHPELAHWVPRSQNHRETILAYFLTATRFASNPTGNPNP